MKTTYRLTIIGRDGMYTYGDTAATPALAKLSPGSIIIKEGDRLGIHEAIWRDSVNAHVLGRNSMCIDRLVLIQAEEFSGQWEIGVPNGAQYRPAKTDAPQPSTAPETPRILDGHPVPYSLTVMAGDVSVNAADHMELVNTFIEGKGMKLVRTEGSYAFYEPK